MQKKRCPFFFLDGRFESLVALSLSEPSLSSSPSPMCTSWVDLCASSLLCSLLLEADGVSLSSRAGTKGEVGSGRWAASPPVKVLRVGVLAEGSSARTSSTGFGSTKKVLLGRGVVGVVSSPGRACGGSGTGNVVLTAWKVDMLEDRAASRLKYIPPLTVRVVVGSCAGLRGRVHAYYVAGCTQQQGTLANALAILEEKAKASARHGQRVLGGASSRGGEWDVPEAGGRRLKRDDDE